MIDRDWQENEMTYDGAERLLPDPLGQRGQTVAASILDGLLIKISQDGNSLSELELLDGAV